MDFNKEVENLGLKLNNDREQKFETYFKELVEVNQYMNLTAITEREEVYRKHFLDSLEITRAIKQEGVYTLCDVGSGAGFPSIPLKIAFPDMKLTIIDPLSKRMEFLKIVIKELNLKDVEILKLRAEDASKTMKERFDIVTARAVARLNILVELIAQLVKKDGLFISMKGIKGQEELLEANNAIKVCGFELIEQVKLDPSINYYFKKIKDTPNKYPRNYGQIKNKPL